VAAGTKPTQDIKLIVLLQKAFRHCKPVAAWGDGTAALAAAGIDLDAAGVLVADSVNKSFTDALADAVGLLDNRCANGARHASFRPAPRPGPAVEHTHRGPSSAPFVKHCPYSWKRGAGHMWRRVSFARSGNLLG
jgi:hypothetical protein